LRGAAVLLRDAAAIAGLFFRAARILRDAGSVWACLLIGAARIFGYNGLFRATLLGSRIVARISTWLLIWVATIYTSHTGLLVMG